MVTGRVLQFDPARGYGFVAAEDGGADVFLHASVFDGDADLLAPGMKVEFKIMAGERGRKAFDARLMDGAAGPGDGPVQVGLNPSITAARSAPAVPQPRGQEDAPGDEQMCDLLSQAELGQEITELLIANVPSLTGQQILGIRQGVLECARKHGWVDI